MKFEGLATDRMRKPKVSGMEHDPRKEIIGFSAFLAINGVSGQGISQVMHMDPDLVGSTGEECDIEKGVSFPIGGDDPVARLGGFPGGGDGKFLAVSIRTADGCIDEPPF